MARTNISFYAILGILGFGEMSGYSIKSWVDEGVGYFLEIDYKQIYPTLRKMVEEGLAEFKIVKNANRPASKVYKLTNQGLEELKTWLCEPIKEGKQADSILKLKLFFGHHIAVEKNIEQVQRYRSSVIRTLETISEIKYCIEKEEGSIDPSKYYRLTTVMNGEIMCKANIEWCDKTIEYLQQSIKTAHEI